MPSWFFCDSNMLIFFWKSPLCSGQSLVRRSSRAIAALSGETYSVKNTTKLRWVWASHSLHSIQHFLFLCPFDNSHSNRGEVVFHCGFELCFSADYLCWEFFFTYLLAIFMLTFQKYLFQSLVYFKLDYCFVWLFLYWVVCVPYTFWISLLSHIHSMQIFSLILCWLFPLLCRSYFFSIWYNSICYFISCAFRVILKNCCWNKYSECFFLCFILAVS